MFAALGFRGFSSQVFGSVGIGGFRFMGALVYGSRGLNNWKKA